MTIEAERALLGVAINAPEHITRLAYVEVQHLTTPAHREIWRILCLMQKHGEAIDLVTLPRQVHDADYVRELARSAPQPKNVQHYAVAILESYACRLRVEAGAILQASPDARERVLTARKLIADAETVQRRASPSATDGEAVMVRSAEAMMDDAKAQEEGRLGFPSGVRALNCLLHVRRGHLVVLAARPAMGKTALMLHPLRAAIRAGHRVGVYSLEMSAEELGRRLISEAANIPYGLITRSPASLHDNQWSATWAAAKELGSHRWYVNDTPGLSASQLVADCEHQHAVAGLDVVIVDYLTLMRFRGDNRTLAVGEAATELKRMAKRLNCAVWLLSQLNRKNEQRPDKRPILSDLRDSGQIEQDADAIVFIHRECIYDEHAPPDGAEIIVAKQRRGPTGVAYCRFEGRYQRFSDMEG